MTKGWLDEIQRKALALKLEQAGIELPENPTRDQLKELIFEFIQNVKEAQNTDPWSDEDWREMSQHLEIMEKLASKL